MFYIKSHKKKCKRLSPGLVNLGMGHFYQIHLSFTFESGLTVLANDLRRRRRVVYMPNTYVLSLMFSF